MSVALYLLGAALGAAGVAMIGFGIPINEFSLGNTLIMAGATALSGGFVVIGLASAVRQLTRIAEALTQRPSSRGLRPVDVTEHAVAAARQPVAPVPTARVPFPPKPRPEPRPDAAREPRQPHTQQSSAEIEPPEEVKVERPRPNFSPGFRTGAPPIVQEADEVPLSPRPGAPADADIGDESKPWPPAPALERLRNSGAVESRASAETIARAGARRDTPGLFESVWPSSSSSRRAEHPEEPSRRNEPTSSPVTDAAPESGASEPLPVSILKSGVVDGMAYTLYTDGSIEAELAEGVVRFASIEELRTHLEKSG